MRDEDGKVIARVQPSEYRQKYIIPCGTECHPQSKQKAGGLAVGRLHHVCDVRALSDVCRCLVQSRIDRVVIGSMNPKAGCAGSVLNLLQIAGFNHQVETVQGVCQEECSTMLSEFFKELREKKKRKKKCSGSC